LPQRPQCRARAEKLKHAGVLNWLRRCTAIFKDGRCVLDQDTNAYAILPS
jgi:hypothetical protein